MAAHELAAAEEGLRQAKAAKHVAPTVQAAAQQLFGHGATAHDEGNGITTFGGEEVVPFAPNLVVWRRHQEEATGLSKMGNGETVRYAFRVLPPQLSASVWYVRPERLPHQGGCVAASRNTGEAHSRGGGVTLAVQRRMIAFFCCANHEDDKPPEAKAPNAAGWTPLPGKFEMQEHAFQPCTFFQKVLEPGELHVACCSDVWGTGVMLAEAE